jgi:hypothetical protein
MKIAPHLPDKKDNNNQHKVKHFGLKYILLILIFSILSGAASALAIEAWLVPSGYVGTKVSIERNNSQQDKQDQQLSQIKQQQLEQRLVKIYNRDELIEGKYYPASAKITTAALLSSSGWVVLHQSDFKVSQVQNWQAVDHRGQIRQIEMVKTTKATDLVYLKLSGSVYRVNSFYDWSRTPDQLALWSNASDWTKTRAGYKQIDNNDTKFSSIKTPQFNYTLADNGIVSDGPMFNKSGKLVGFVGESNSITPSWYISARLNQLLSGQEFTNNFPNLTGSFVKRKINNDQIETASGFLVREYPNVEKIRKGDLILEINDTSITQSNAAKISFGFSTPKTLTILRAGEVKNISL